MRPFSAFATVACLGVLVPLAASVPSQRQAPRSTKAPAADATAKIVAASQAFLTTLDAAGKSYDVQVGPDKEHSAVAVTRMMEFFVTNLMARPGTVARSSQN